MSTENLPDDSTAGHITLRYWAAAKSAAGVETDTVDVDGPVDLASLVAEAVRRHGGSKRLSDVLDCCSVMVGDRPVASQERATVSVPPGSSVEFLPPFAGG